MQSLFQFSGDLALLRSSVKRFARDQIAPRAAAIDRDNQFPHELWPKLGELGLLGITVPEADGGAEMGCVGATIAMEEMSVVDASTTLSYLAHSILCVNQIARNEQLSRKNRRSLNSCRANGSAEWE